jgi:hypothetical protein
MAEPHHIIRTGEEVGRNRTSAHEIDGLLCELSQLYREHAKTLRTGDYKTVQIVIDKIAILRMKLDRL